MRSDLRPPPAVAVDLSCDGVEIEVGRHATYVTMPVGTPEARRMEVQLACTYALPGVEVFVGTFADAAEES